VLALAAAGTVVVAAPAKTVDGERTFDIAPRTWQVYSVNDAMAAWTCTALAHEYGHALGYPDGASPAIMDTDVSPQFDPLCERAFEPGPELFRRRDGPEPGHRPAFRLC